jgi:hypothetical protein
MVMKRTLHWGVLVLMGLILVACAGETPEQAAARQLRNKYTPVTLTADLSKLTDNQRQMIPLLIEAAQAMDDGFWLQAYGDKEALLAGISDPALRRLVEINYGPWDRLAGNEPFVEGVGTKPEGANFYPTDMTKEEFEVACAESPERAAALRNLYTIVRRDAAGSLAAVPYSEAFVELYLKASGKLRQAAELAEDPGFKKYLNLRANALLTDEYQPSDMAWMDMKNNSIDVVIGPIETYEDQLYGYKSANEAYVLIKDMEWSARLAKYTTLLPTLQEGLPVPDRYKQEQPGLDSDLNAYDVIYYAGDCNAGAKTIAINLPNDEVVQDQKGSRRLQLKNTMQAKFEKILLPITDVLIDEEQQQHVRFEAFFANTMFHEVAHGLGIRNTLDGSGTVREALKERASRMEEGKADVLGLYMIAELLERGEYDDATLMDHYVTFTASIFRSIRFGATSAHGIANTVRFNFFKQMGAFTRDPETGTYRVNPEKTHAATNALSEKILRLQGDGDYEGVVAFINEMGQIGDELQGDLDRLAEAGIPVDIVVEQGLSVLGLELQIMLETVKSPAQVRLP